MLLIVGAGMIAFDGYMSNDRRDGLRGGLIAGVENRAAEYGRNQDAGCVDGCGFVGALAHHVIGVRDGVFVSLPFDPETVLPEPPEGWVTADYALATAEEIIGEAMGETGILGSPQSNLMKYFDDVAKASNVGAARVYRQDNAVILLAVMIDRNGLRAAKGGEQVVMNVIDTPYGTLDGLPIEDHSPVIDVIVTNEDGEEETERGFAYRHLSLNMDQQVGVSLLARVEEADLQTFLSGFDLAPIVAGLPKTPTAYQPGTGLVVPEAAAETEEE